MRELTKSMLRASWALPLFGIRQMTALSLPTEANLESAAKAFDAVSEAAQQELGALKAIFDAGDRLQSGIVDATLGAAAIDMLNPLRWVPGGRQSSTSAATSAPTTPSTAPATPSTQAAAGEGGGWGPIPTAP